MNQSRSQIANAFIDLANTKGYEYAVQSLSAYAHQHKSLDIDLLLKDIARALETRGHVNIELHSARSLNDASKKYLTDYLTELTSSKTSSMTEFIDPDLIGGVKAITSEFELDWTVRGRMNRLMKQGGNL